MKRIFGAVLFVIGVSNTVQGVITLNGRGDHGMLILAIGIVLIVLGIWLEVLAFRKGKNYN